MLLLPPLPFPYPPPAFYTGFWVKRWGRASWRLASQPPPLFPTSKTHDRGAKKNTSAHQGCRRASCFLLSKRLLSGNGRFGKVGFARGRKASGVCAICERTAPILKNIYRSVRLQMAPGSGGAYPPLPGAIWQCGSSTDRSVFF